MLIFHLLQLENFDILFQFDKYLYYIVMTMKS